MEIPASFQTAIASKMYTDTITPMQQTEQADTEGGVKRVATTAGTPVNVNAQPIGDELRQSLLGESIEADYKITAPADIPVDKGSLVSYQNSTYEVVDFKQYDSHAEMLIKRWVQP